MVSNSENESRGGLDYSIHRTTSSEITAIPELLKKLEFQGAILTMRDVNSISPDFAIGALESTKPFCFSRRLKIVFRCTLMPRVSVMTFWQTSFYRFELKMLSWF